MTPAQGLFLQLRSMTTLSKVTVMLPLGPDLVMDPSMVTEASWPLEPCISFEMVTWPDSVLLTLLVMITSLTVMVFVNPSAEVAMVLSMSRLMVMTVVDDGGVNVRSPTLTAWKYLPNSTSTVLVPLAVPWPPDESSALSSTDNIQLAPVMGVPKSPVSCRLTVPEY